MLTFTPMTEQEIDELNLIEPGVYKFLVLDAENALSEANKPVIRLKIKIWVDGKEKYVKDSLSTGYLKKINHFCKYTGLIEQYMSGKLTAEDCKNKEGYLDLTKQPSDGKFNARNSVKDYVAKPVNSIDNGPQIVDDEIPF